MGERWRSRTGPKCPHCAAFLTKRKSDMTLNCAKHGFVRNINTPVESYIALAEKEKQHDNQNI